MQSVGADKALLYEQPYCSQDQLRVVQSSQQMWDYRNKNTLNGIPVAEQARDINAKSLQQVQRALDLKYEAKVWTGYISPQQQDKEYVKQYTEIKQAQAQGSVVIYSQDRQFCPALNKFLVLLSYAVVQYGLNQRYNYMKKENTDE